MTLSLILRLKVWLYWQGGRFLALISSVGIVVSVLPHSAWTPVLCVSSFPVMMPLAVLAV